MWIHVPSNGACALNPGACAPNLSACAPEFAARPPEFAVPCHLLDKTLCLLAQALSSCRQQLPSVNMAPAATAAPAAALTAAPLPAATAAPLPAATAAPAAALTYGSLYSSSSYSSDLVGSQYGSSSSSSSSWSSNSSSDGESDSDASTDDTSSDTSHVSLGTKTFTAALRYCVKYAIPEKLHFQDMQLAHFDIEFFREMVCVPDRFQMHYDAKEFLAWKCGLGKPGISESGIWLHEFERFEEQEWCWHWLLADLEWESMIRAVTGHQNQCQQGVVGIGGCSIEPRQRGPNIFSVIDSDLKIWRTDGSVLVMMLQQSGKQIPCFELRTIHGETAKKWYREPLVFH